MSGAAVRRPAEGTGARARLLEAAAELIIERQSIEISLADLAARAGLNAALVKYYFGSKTGLLVALLQRDAARALTGMQELLALEVGAGEKMRRHLRGIMTTYRHSPYLNRLLHEMLQAPEAPVREEVHRLLVQPVFDCQRRILEEGAARGEFRVVDARIFYLAAIGACDQFMQTGAVLGEAGGAEGGAVLEAFRDRYIAHVLDMVLASLAVRPC